MTILQEFNKEIEKDIKRLNSEVVGFHSNLVKQAPVDTGDFRRAWRLEREGKMSFRIVNNQNYADILWRGRRMGVSSLGNAKMYGSEQWPQGGEPMLDTFKERIRRIV